jgi:hypothetical protein
VDTAVKLLHEWRERAWQGAAAGGGSGDACAAPGRAASDAGLGAPAATDGSGSGSGSGSRLVEAPGDGSLQVARRSMSETTGHCRPFSAGQLLLSRLGTRQQQQQPLSQQQQQQPLPPPPQQQQHELGPPPLGDPRLATGSTSNPAATARQQAVGTGGTAGSARPPPLNSSGAAGLQASGRPLVLQVPEAWQYGGAAAAEVVEPVTASLLGTFSFKGSGVYAMAAIAHASLAGRPFPDEAPKGKGHRTHRAEGVLPGLEPVGLVVPAQLLAARGAYASEAARRRPCS